MSLSPLTQRRWQQFKANRRGFYSLIMFLVLFFGTLFAEGIANDKPILMKANGNLYMPVFQMVTEKELGGDFDTEADYRDSFVQDLVKESDGWMVWPMIRYSYDTINFTNPKPAPSAPDAENWLGTDDQGRDV